MTRIVYVGGFSSGRKTVESVGNALEIYYDDVEAYRLSELFTHPKKIQIGAMGASLLTHSAGALALLDRQISPKSALLVNPPLVRKYGSLVYNHSVNSPLSEATNFRRNLSGIKISENLLSSIGEMAAHPLANFTQLPKIFHYDAVEVAAAATDLGIKTSIIWTEHDDLFAPSATDIERALTYSVPFCILQGGHHALTKDPVSFLGKINTERS